MREVDSGELSEAYIRSYSRNRIRKRVLFVLSCIVVFVTSYTLILPAITMEKKTTVICGKSEHTHREDCYAEKTAITFTCADGLHAHTYACYNEAGELFCGRADRYLHTHDESCYDKDGKLICPLEEYAGEAHIHDPSCYDENNVLICPLPETAGGEEHIHEGSCFDESGALICGRTEQLLHVHTEECRHVETTKVLICDVEEHVHTDECLPHETITLRENEFTCGFAYEHTHGEDCYGEEGVLTCTLTEHTHDKSCRFNKDADIETAEDWEASFASVTFTGNMGEDAAAIARTQIGCGESERNYRETDGAVHGYTRYGAWFGDPYCEWDAAFCAFCLTYAGADPVYRPAEPSAARWMEALKDAECYRAAGEYVPAPGDVLFLTETDEETETVRAVLVTSVDMDGEDVTVTVIGREGTAVSEELPLSLTDARVTGFAQVKETKAQQEARLVTLTAELEKGLTVTVSALPEALPYPVEELTLRVSVVENEDAGYLMSEAASADGVAGETTLLFDIKLIHDGREVEPSGELNVLISGLADEETGGVAVYHINTESEEVQDVESVLEDDGTVNISTDHFSLYGVTLLAAADVGSLSELPLSNGGTLTLTRDYKVTSTINISRNTTLDLNGHKIYADCDPVFNVTGGTLTINDSGTAAVTETVVPDAVTNSHTAAYMTGEEIGVASYALTDSSVFSPWGDGALSHLFDNNISTKIGGSVSGGSLSIEITPSDTSAVLSKYTLTSAGDTANYSSRVPKSWVVSGYNGSRWTTLSSVSSMPVDSSTEHVYTVDNTTAYRKYRIVFSTNSAFQMAEMKLYSTADERLEYYVTETEVTDPANGVTTETLKKYTVTGGGMIIGDKAGRAITVSGGTVNLNGGYITNFSRSVDSEDSRGGAVKVTGGTVNIRGAVLAGNYASDGGAVYVSGSNATLNILEGAVIAGNTATRSHYFNWSGYGGGGVYLDNNATVNMSGGYVTNNVCSNEAGACNGGGGFMVNGSRLNISGGYITGNGGPGGGGIMTARVDSYNAGGKVYMTGGFVTANTSYTKEGGGISLDGYGYMELTGGYVTNNYCKGGYTDSSFGDWGGGGIFVSDYQALLYIENVLVTQNKAGGFGGGLAGCSTGRLNIAVDDVCASFDNTALGENLSGAGNQKNEDHTYAAQSDVFMENGFQDYYCALSSIVSGGMLGEGTAMWTGSIDGEAVVSTSRDDTLTAASVMGLTAHPSEQDKANASAAARVFITGNESPTHGGGVLANGYLMIGPQQIESFCRLEFGATKSLITGTGGSASLGSRVFNFAVEDEYGTVIMNGSNDSSGKISFDNRVSFTAAGTYIFYAYELEPDSAGGTRVVKDGAKYKIEVDVVKNSSTITVDGKNYTKNVYQFREVRILDAATGSSVRTYKTSDGTLTNNENHAVSLDPTGGRAFKNYSVSSVDIVVNKVWANSGSHSPVTVNLLRNGEVISTQTLSSSNSWAYTWSRQSTGTTTVPYHYTVTENAVGGYITTYSVLTEGTSSSSRAKQTVTITNTPTGNTTYKLNVKKVSAEDASVLLPGAEFSVKNAAGETLYFTYNATTARYALSTRSTDAGRTQTLVTANNGYFRVDGFPAGTYTLTETNAPEGYTAVPDTQFTLTEQTPDQSLTLVLEDPEYRGGPRMPATGGSGTLVFLLVGAALMILSTRKMCEAVLCKIKIMK